MSYAVLLAAGCGVDGDEHAVSLSAQIAQRQASLVRVLPAFPDELAAVTGWGAAGAYLTTEVIEDLQAIRNDQTDKLRACAEAIAAREGLALGPGSGPRLVVEPVPTLPWLALSLALPLVDLVVLGAGATRGDGLANGPFATALMSARAPILVARGPDLPVKGVAAIAWNGRPEAGRAVRAALPLLREADQVVILQDRQGLDDDEREAAAPERLIDYLGRCGVPSAQAKPVIHGAEGGPLLAAAKKAGAHLLVAGAYGHSRMREWVLGGATRAFLDAADGPHLLIAH